MRSVPALALALALAACGSTEEAATPDAGDFTTDAGEQTSDAGELAPDAGEQTSDAGFEQSVCDACGQSKCGESLTACNSDPRCREFADCVYVDCESGDNTCIGDCYVDHEVGSQLFMASANCLRTECVVECDL